MSTPKRSIKIMVAIGGMVLALLAANWLTSWTFASAQPLEPVQMKEFDQAVQNDVNGPASPFGPAAVCPDGTPPVIDGITLSECYTENFTVGGSNKSVRVWYTKNPITATRTVDGNPVVLSHWINTDAQAQQVAAWGRQAWERYWVIFGRHPYDTGCGDRINVQLEDGVGWAGIAYWGSPGNCHIGIDSPMIRNGGGQWVVYHEFGHYQQYSFNSGCYAYLQANYPADSEFVEGYADLSADAVTTTTDATGYSNAVAGYTPDTSMYDKSYGNVYNKYFIEQLGTLYTPADPWHHMDANRRHYEECDSQDTLYVLDDLIPALKPGMTEEKLFLNFFAANWAKDWANATTQPELVYTDDDGNPYGQIALAHDVNLSTGAQSWSGESLGATWAGRYYQVRPQTGCNYVTVGVNGSASSHLGINLMAAHTSSPASVSRTSWIGQGITRTFAAAGVNNRIVAAVNRSDSAGGTFDVSFTCVTPILDIVEPRQTNFALVGEPASPIAFLARFRVTSGGTPVRGLSESSFSADAEGAPITILTGTLQEVGEEYWAVMLPPVKPAGTTFVDFKICLDSTICDTETHALLYADPGTTDFALVFDASGSMLTEDVTGEGKRVDNAKRAGTVLADLLRDGDRVAVTDFSAHDNPVGCGLPGGDGNCALDLQTRLARTDVVVPATITATKNAIDLISAREWTPIGAALRDAKDKLMAVPANDNPKHIILLSDGEENVNPLYAAISADLIASGVIVDTIAFSGDAPASLLGQIAAETGGTLRYVPTTSGTRASTSAAQADRAAQVKKLVSQGFSPALVESLLTAPLPGHLGLADVYDYYETIGQDASRIFHDVFAAAPANQWKTSSRYVDASVTTLRLVAASKQADSDVTRKTGDYPRRVQILPPGGNEKDWIEISPVGTGGTPLPPSEWDIRNSTYDDVVIIPKPAEGIWKMRTRYIEVTADLMMNGSVESNFHLQGRFLPPIVNNRGMAGDRVPIVAVVLGPAGTVPGLLVAAAIEKPGTTDSLWLFDDGLHSDGAAGDGIYGNYYSLTDVGGVYNVRIVAGIPFGGDWVTREWTGAFWIDGPNLKQEPPWDGDKDRDGLPDVWEKRCGLDTGSSADASGDFDHDGLTNIQEFHNGTIPCDADTDDGGENDGSEVRGGRNPLYAPDDVVRPVGHINIRALNKMILIRWTRPLSYTGMMLYVSTNPAQLGSGIDMGTSGIYTYTGAANDQPYFLTVQGITGTVEGDYSSPIAATPKADPDAPSGAMTINGGAASTVSGDVMLDLSATDTPLDGMAESASAGLGGGPLALAYNTVSGGVEMRISNDAAFAGASWEPLASVKSWALVETSSGISRVYAQFRDAAHNESLVIWDDIVFLNRMYLPIALKQ
jgi:hypothetical protein